MPARALLALVLPLSCGAMVATPLRPSSTAASSASWDAFRAKAMGVIEAHPVVVGNKYTSWFAKGVASEAQQKDLVQQFSVFSQLFLIAQLQKIINAPTLEEMREGKEILANEIGVVFKPSGGREQAADTVAETTGSVDGGIFKHKAAHFEWLLDVAEPLGLGFGDLGKRRIGTEATVHFCDELSRLYANEHDATAIAASFAIENWAAAGFWDDLIAGFRAINEKRSEQHLKKMPVSFWTFHAALEQQHADHTIDELQECFEAGRVVDEDEFCRTCVEMLDAVQVFWDGLEAQRHALDEPPAAKPETLALYSETDF